MMGGREAGVSLAGGAPVDEFSIGDGEFDVWGMRFPSQAPKNAL